MQKYTNDKEIRYFEDDVTASDWIDLSEYRLMTDDEIDRHENPEKYLTDEQRIELSRQRMPNLSPLEFDLLLDKHDLYDAVQDLIAENRTLKIAYNRATYFSRLDPFITQAATLLGLSDEQVDELWLSV